MLFQPANATINGNLIWNTDDTDIAVVQNGTVYARNVGKCIVTVKYNEFVAECEIIVDNDKETLKQNAKTEYEEKVNNINTSFDASISDCENTIINLKREGYYTGSESQYRSQVRSMSNEISKLQQQSDALSGSTSAESRARKAAIDAQISRKQAELDALQNKHANTEMIEWYEKMIRDFKKAKQNSLDSAYQEYQKKLEEIDNLY